MIRYEVKFENQEHVEMFLKVMESWEASTLEDTDGKIIPTMPLLSIMKIESPEDRSTMYGSVLNERNIN
jgi:hypothetical protein